MASGPDFSAIVIPLIGANALANCLDRLSLSALECIVVLQETMGEPRFWQQRYPSVIFLDASHEPVPLRRRRGIAVATSDVVALLEARRGRAQIGALRSGPLSAASRQPPRAGRCGSPRLCRADARRLGGANMAPSRHTMCSGKDGTAPTLTRRSSLRECRATTWPFGAQS